jgi:hypothetical protein
MPRSDFTRFWAALSVSLLGSEITTLALPLLAALTLRASALEMGVLAAAGQLPFLLFSLPAGAWVDRLPRRPVLIATDLASALLLLSVPLAIAVSRIARMLGHDKFDFEWISLYKFQCRRMNKFIHGRVIFAGDAAHQARESVALWRHGLAHRDELSLQLEDLLQLVVVGLEKDRVFESVDAVVEHSEARKEAVDEAVENSVQQQRWLFHRPLALPVAPADLS